LELDADLAFGGPKEAIADRVLNRPGSSLGVILSSRSAALKDFDINVSNVIAAADPGRGLEFM